MVNRTFRIRAVALLLLAAAATTGYSQESYEGLATVGRFGRFPSGLFGASNLVAPNTMVTVRDLATGRSERVIITDGVTEPGVFLVLSPEAAESLRLDPEAASRVRVTPFAADGFPPDDPAAERALSPDPDLNPLASVPLLETLPPPAGAKPPSVSPDAAEPPPEVASEPPISTAPAAPLEPAPGARPRTGVAAGVARTSVGQAQTEFERPDPALPVRRPDAPDDAPTAAREPTLEPADAASAGLEPADRPAERAPDAIALARADEPLPPQPAVAAVEQEEPYEGPIDAAIRAAVTRLPRKDVYPQPAGERGELGFRRVDGPAERAVVASLPEARPPAVERPSLAGLAPLRASEPAIDAFLAEAAAPAEDRPQFQGLARRTAPQPGARTTGLPGTVPTPGGPPDARPTAEGLVRIDPGPSRALDADLATAVPAAEERPDESLAAIAVESPEAPSGIALAPAPPADEETRAAEPTLSRPGDLPEDAILALEPADFRPPASPEPDTDSLIAREEAAREAPEEATPIEVPASAVASLPDESPAPAEREAPRVTVRPSPEEAPAPREAAPEEATGLPVATSAERERYYLQIGAYSDRGAANVPVDALGATYPMTVLPFERGGRTIYRVLVGPLERDETGTLLLWLRSRGYRDSFVRSGAEL